MKRIILVFILLIASYSGVFALYQQINFGCSTTSGQCSQNYDFNLNSGDTFSDVTNIVIELEGDFNGIGETININVNGQSSGDIQTGQQGGGFFPIDSSFINTASLIGDTALNITGVSTVDVNNGFTSNGNTWNLRISFDYHVNSGGDSGTGTTSEVIVNIDNGEGINKEIFDLETYTAIMEIEGILMVLIIFWKFWSRLLQLKSKRRKNFIF